MNTTNARPEMNAPVLLADGSFGIVIRDYGDCYGVQVPGEEDIRQIADGKLEPEGDGAWRELA